MKRSVVVLVVMGLLVGCVFAVSAQDEAWIPGLASFLIPGLGQVLNDEVSKGIVHFLVMVGIDAGARFLAYGLPSYLRLYMGYGIWAFSLGWRAYSGLDAYNVAKDTGFTLGWRRDKLTLSYGLAF